MDNRNKPTAEQLNKMLTSLFQEYADYLLDYAQNYGCSPDLAEDMVQETFTIAVQKAENLYYAVSQRGWLILTLRNTISNYQRNIMYAQRLLKKLELQLLDVKPEPLSPSLLYEGLIDQKDLDLLIRYWSYGESVKSIAKSLGISEDACRKRLYRAKERLKDALDQEAKDLGSILSFFLLGVQIDPPRYITGRKGVNRLMEKDIETMKQYDDYTVEELRAALQRYFLFSELDDEAVDEMEQILAVLRKKAPFTHMHTNEEMWEEFKAAHADDFAALGIRKETETEEVVEQKPEADETVIRSEPVPVRKPRRQIRGLLRVGLIAAALIVLLAGVTVAASAMGYNLWGWIPKWTDEDVRFVAETPLQTPGEDDNHGISSILASMGITEPLYPTWLPEDFMRVESKTVEDPLFLYENFQGNNRFLSITISPTTDLGTVVYQKEDVSPVEYKVGNTLHYLFNNTNETSAVWNTDNYSTLIVGDISIEEMERIIDSVYEERK